MARLIPCPSCESHVLVGDRECPHCGTSLRTTTASRGSAILMGLALSGCQVQAVYGVEDTSDTSRPPATDSGATDTDTDTDTDTGGTTTATDTSGSTGMTEGDTTAGSDGSSGSGTEATGSSSVGEPEYGVPETTTG